jgi:CHASE3 domain sensor protein
MKSTIQKRIITIGTIILVGIIATITVITFNQIKKVGNTTQSLVQTQDIILRSHQLTASTVHYEMNAEAFLEKEDKILENEIMLGKQKIDDIISFLTSQTIDNPKEQMIIDSFVNSAKVSVLFSGKLIASKKSGQLIATDQQALINECKTKVDSVINLANHLQSFENTQQQTQQSNTDKEIQNLKDSFYYFIGGMDWGRENPFSLHITGIQKKEHEGVVFYRAFTFLELYGTNKSPKDWGNEFKKLLELYNMTLDDVKDVQCDNQIFNKGLLLHLNNFNDVQFIEYS